MGFWDLLTGKSAADTARQAAELQYGRQVAAGNQYRADTAGIADQYFSPYVESGRQTNSLVADYLGVNGPEAQARAYQNYQQSPGTDFLLEQGTQAIDRSAASPSRSLNSGRVLKELTRFGQGVAQQDFGNHMSRLMGFNQQGLGAAGAAAGLEGQGAAGQFNANFQSAGTVPQGMVAGAQAQQTALGNLMSLGGYLGGAALGSFGGGASRASSYAPTTVYGAAGGYGVPTFGR